MYHGSAQGVVERMINVHSCCCCCYYYYYSDNDEVGNNGANDIDNNGIM